MTNAGYQGPPAPDQWFGGPALSASAGNMVLRDAHGLVADSLNYGSLVGAGLDHRFRRPLWTVGGSSLLSRADHDRPSGHAAAT